MVQPTFPIFWPCVVQLLFTSEGRVAHVNDSKCDREASSVNCELTSSSVKFSSRISIALVFFFTMLNKEFCFMHNLKRFLWREKENHSNYIHCSLGACFLGFALFTLSLQYIYTRWSLSACSCSLHTLSPSPDLNKTSLASLSALVVALFTLSHPPQI